MSKGRVLAIDYGTKNVGLAVSDTDRTIAFPRQTLVNDGSLLEALADFVSQEAVVEIVVGLPYYTDHTEAEFAEVVRNFVTDLKAKITIPIVLQDEKLTSFDAKDRIKKAPAKLVNDDKDQLAALIILEEYLGLSRLAVDPDATS